LGRILQLLSENEAAKGAFEKSVELKPEQTESQYQLADIALKSGQYTAAIDEAAKVLARDPHHIGALADTGIALFRLKQYDRAADVLHQATQAAATYQPAHYYLGLALARLGRKQESDQELTTAARLASDENARSSQRLHLIPQ
jgi:tetratricopeptide (TPR) repeat protein